MKATPMTNNRPAILLRSFAGCPAAAFAGCDTNRRARSDNRAQQICTARKRKGQPIKRQNEATEWNPRHLASASTRKAHGPIFRGWPKPRSARFHRRGRLHRFSAALA
jgi:hypothetical protein